MPKLNRAVIHILTLAIICGNAFAQSRLRGGLNLIQGKGTFYNDTATGTLAFIPSVLSAETVQATNDFWICGRDAKKQFILPRQQKYWFVVNHKAEHSSRPTYLGVEILLIYRDKPLENVYLYRNEGWRRQENAAFQITEIGKAFEDKTIPDFLRLHDSNAVLQDFDKEFFEWHGSPMGSMIDSWEKRIRWLPRHSVDCDEFRNSFSPSLPANVYTMLNGYLLKFITSETVPQDRWLKFWILGKDNPIAAAITTFSPDDPEFDGEYFITFVR